MNYLEKALKRITDKGVYMTPLKVENIINLNLLLINPPYEQNSNTNI